MFDAGSGPGSTVPSKLPALDETQDRSLAREAHRDAVRDLTRGTRMTVRVPAPVFRESCESLPLQERAACRNAGFPSRPNRLERVSGARSSPGWITRRTARGSSEDDGSWTPGTILGLPLADRVQPTLIGSARSPEVDFPSAKFFSCDHLPVMMHGYTASMRASTRWGSCGQGVVLGFRTLRWVTARKSSPQPISS